MRGRASARETAGRVAAAGIAEKYLSTVYGVEIVAWVSQVGDVALPRHWEASGIGRDEVDVNMMRCPDEDVAAQMMKVVDTARNANDSVGGHVTCVVRCVFFHCCVFGVAC